MNQLLLMKAVQFAGHGFSVLPIRADGTKAPAVPWDGYKTTAATIPQIQAWFGNGTYHGIGIVCGEVSGNLEMMELEGRAVAEGLIEQICQRMADHDLDGVWNRIVHGYSEQSPSGGVHLMYRVDGQVPGNTRIARRPSTQAELDAEPGKKIQVLIETRGEGGQVVVAPSGGECHETGRGWVQLDGGPATIPTISEDERNAICAILATFDQMPKQAPKPERPAEPRDKKADPKPGDLLAKEKSWADILEPHGWVCTSERDGWTYWTRPGKSGGISASTREDTGLMTVFSTSTELYEDGEDGKEPSQTKPWVWAKLNHGGDMSKAMSAYAIDRANQMIEGMIVQPAVAPVTGIVPATPEADEDDPDTGGTRPRKPGTDALVYVMLASHEFARDTGGELFMLPGGRLTGVPYIPRSFLTRDVINLAHNIWREMAERFNAWLRAGGAEGLSEKQRKDKGFAIVGNTPSDTLVRNAVSHLEALGMEHGRKVTASLRAVEVPGGIVIDLGDDTGRVVHVTAAGWTVTDPRVLDFAPPVFRRSVGYLPLPEPVRGGDLDDLWKILRVTDDTAKALATGWLTAVYFPDVSRPGLWPTGAPGSGKTTLGGGLARLIDGTDWLDGRLDKSDERNNIVRAARCYVVSFDNMSGVTADMSDWICQLVTGHRDMYRRMRTNFDDISMAYKRTFIATGLSLPYGLAADALDRIIEIPLEPIAETRRVTDEQIRRELDKARPELLGALLDHIVKVLGKLPSIPVDGTGLTRMNGYARILIAHDAAYPPGEDKTGCLAAYLESVRQVRADKADGEPVAVALLRFMPKPSTWTGTATELYSALVVHRTFDAGAYWPGDARHLSRHLTALDSVLREQGFTITHGQRTAKGRPITISRQ